MQVSLVSNEEPLKVKPTLQLVGFGKLRVQILDYLITSVFKNYYNLKKKKKKTIKNVHEVRFF